MATRRLAWIAAALAALVALSAALTPLLPSAPAALAFDRAAIAAGQGWRLLTGHVAHWTGEHLLWDLAVFVVLSLLAIRLSPARYLVCLPAATLAISLAIWSLRPDLLAYRGLSGLDSALFVLIVMRLLTAKAAARQWGRAAVILAMLTAFAGKTAYEFFTGRTLFIQDLGTGISCVPLAHVAGGLLGAIVGCWRTEKSPCLVDMLCLAVCGLV